MLRYPLAAIVATILLCSTASAATITVQPGGSANSAAQSAQAGDTIVLAPGQYGSQSITTTKQLTFKAAGARMPGLSISGSNFTWDGGDVDSQGGVRQAMYFSNAHSVTLKNLRVGNNRESILIMMDGGYPTTGSVTDITFDHVEFHDSYIAHGSAKHVECVFMGGTQRIKFLNSWFHDCTTFNVFVTEAGGDLPDGLTVENTVMEGPWADGDPNIGEMPRSIGQPGLAWRSSTGLVRNATLRNNTFLSEVRWPSTTPQGTNKAVGNIFAGGTSCKSGVTFAYNVKTGGTCSSTDKSVTSFGFVRAGADGGDYHLTAGSPAVDAASPADHPALDYDGVARSATMPDAGAYELAGSAPPPPPADTTAPDTTITDGPVDSQSTDATVTFTSSEAGSSFECRLDAGPWSSCTSPKQYTGLAVGQHTISVRATDVAGNTDSTPAARSWTISEPPPPDPCAQTKQDLADAQAEIDSLTGQIASLSNQLSQANADVAAWKARAEKAEDQVTRIRAITGE